MKKLIQCFIYFASIFYLSTSWAGDLTIPNAFVAGTPAVAADVNANFSAVEAEVDDNNNRIVTNAGDISANTNAVGSLQSQTQNLVTGCLAGEAIRAIATDGTITCEVDDVTTSVGDVIHGSLLSNTAEVSFTMSSIIGAVTTIDIADAGDLYKSYRCMRRAIDSMLCLDLVASLPWTADLTVGGTPTLITEADFVIAGRYTATGDVMEVVIRKITSTNIIYQIAGGN